ncbi:hypothetical protein [Urbifossiella limnaea]|uniref:Lipoprotein n=1 Tax=Urbifossiella limnaea TaxID=2528023 RepID=A0A517XLD4_9BACT|nr:hypothetical protein [Urbifossiella limnaea]QDU18314.1 hypothetical protein ETAA1_01990 [Urbifossiella limnaea]
MTTTCRTATLAAALALAGCGRPAAPTTKDDKGGPGPAPPANIPSGPVAPTDASSVAAQKVVGDLLTGTADTTKLTTSFLKAVGLPATSPEDKAKGYSPAAAHTWLARAGAALTQIGPPDGFTASTSAVFTGPNGTGRYLVRMVQADGAWKADYFGLGTAKANEMAKPKTSDEAFQDFAVLGLLDALTSTALPTDDRVPLAAALMSAKARGALAGPFPADQEQGYDYNRGKLGVVADGLGKGATAVSRTRTGADAFRAEITKDGATRAFAVKLVRDAAGGWVVDDFKPE